MINSFINPRRAGEDEVILTKIIERLAHLIAVESESDVRRDVESGKLNELEVLIGRSSESCDLIRADLVFGYLLLD